MTSKLLPGRPFPLGAHWDGQGVNFAVASSHAEAIDLCLYDDGGRVLRSQQALPARSHDVFHGYLPGAAPGLVYGLRAHGLWQPSHGHRFNPAKLLLDPYAREIVGQLDWSTAVFGHRRDDPAQPDTADNGPQALKARVVVDDDGFDWGDDRPLQTPLQQTVLYELHVKGFTRQHPGVPLAQQGSYAGLASDAAIDHLKRLGVTAVSLLPVHQHVDEERLVRMGLRNYWGYNTIGFFAVEPGYASGAEGLSPRDEFRGMVKRLHAAGFEVILDVVFNHTAESDDDGPALSWRGLDNAGSYRLRAGDASHYENDTGCGNTLDLRQPRMLQMVLDSLRYWVQVMHVDGFRFDLAPVLGRGDHGFTPHHPFFIAAQQCPVLAGVKLIAEPWDIGLGGYRLGQFPAGWSEWNDRFRDTMRAWWLGHPSSNGDFARRLAGSSDLFNVHRRRPSASVNFIVAHDGFCLRDLLSYESKRNHANGEDNRDGHSHNLGWNAGAEGPSDDPVVLERRRRLTRALLATLLLAQGTPMLTAGDELGHGQDGNNNPYCQDNPITWIDWSGADEALIGFTARVLTLRRELQTFGDTWHTGEVDASGLPDLGWRRADGEPLQPGDWQPDGSRRIAAWIGRPAGGGGSLLLLFNGQEDDVDFRLPVGCWLPRLDTADVETGVEAGEPVVTSTTVRGRSLMVLQALSD